MSYAMNTKSPLRKILLDLYTRQKKVAELRPEWEYDPLQAVRDQLSTNHALSTKEGNKIAAQEFGMMLQVAQQAQDESQLVQLAQSLP